MANTFNWKNSLKNLSIWLSSNIPSLLNSTELVTLHAVIKDYVEIPSDEKEWPDIDEPNITYYDLTAWVAKCLNDENYNYICKWFSSEGERVNDFMSNQSNRNCILRYFYEIIH